MFRNPHTLGCKVRAQLISALPRSRGRGEDGNRRIRATPKDEAPEDEAPEDEAPEDDTHNNKARHGRAECGS